MKKRHRISASEFPLTQKTYKAIERWLDEEEAAIETGRNAPDPAPFVDGWPSDRGKLSHECIPLKIREGGDGHWRGTSPRLFDPATVAALRLCIGFYGSLSLEKVRSEEEGGGQFYPKITSGAPLQMGNTKVGRIVMDTPQGKHAKMLRGGDYKDFRARNLKNGKPRPDFKEGRLTQEDAIARAMSGYDAYHTTHPSFVTREGFEATLRRALELASMRESLRASA